MNIRQAKFSKRLGKEIYPLDSKFVAWCKKATPEQIKEFCDKSYNEDMEYYEGIIKKNYEEYEGVLPTQKELADIMRGSGKEFIAKSNAGFLKEFIDEVSEDDSIVADDQYLFALEEIKYIKDSIEQFRDFFGHIINQKVIDKIDIDDLSKHVVRFWESWEVQENLRMRRNTIKQLINHTKNGTVPHWMHQAYFSKRQNWSQYMSEEDELERETILELDNLLKKKANRDSLNFVFSNLIDSKKMFNKGRKYETACALMESLESAEDIYKRDRRLPGSAYSGKRRK